MTNTHKLDGIDAIVAQWQAEKPLLDLSAMAIIGRLKKCHALMQPQLDKVFERHNLGFWEFDVLATLLRSGKPYCLAPTQLFSTLMVTSGTMTHRMTQLEKRGLIERIPNEHDARSKLVKLSETGFDIINKAVDEHVANELEILSSLNNQQQMQLDQSLKQLLLLLESINS
ncbi:MarR family winged helix-turn-helix transcriptional regulator [Bermanella sp. WJH001]|uniref:MarR family winged helix-turn-helix transcriptional regulator n=1 Tax=Bermanella sp. WJH001 TaxID=3048005 RepID=UPI0024BF0A00|nr:MarR family transcriptional regulator [Bermanella sp. WJH001]MDJ1537499.1 MarR family transcriptional regulator [Bermanella sp. WJH001]